MTTPAAPFTSAGWTEPPDRPRARLPGDRRGAAHDHGRSGTARAEVGPQDDVGVEQGDQGVEVAARGRPGRRRRPRPAGGWGRDPVCRHRGPVAGPGWPTAGWPSATDPPWGRSRRRAGRTCRGGRRPVVRRGRAHQHDLEGQADRIGQEGLLLGLRIAGRADDGVREVSRQRLVPPDMARAQHVEADAGDDRRQPSPEVLDLTRVGPADSDPGVLDGVVGVGERAQHPVGDGPQVVTLLLEALHQPLRSSITHPSETGHHNDPREGPAV